MLQQFHIYLRSVIFCIFQSRDDIVLALLAAARKRDIKIVRRILEEDVYIVLNEIVKNRAVEEGLTSLFEVLVWIKLL